MNLANAHATPSPFPGGRQIKMGILLVAILPALGVLTHASDARADLTIAKGDKWEVSTNGRVNAFLSYINGDGYPAKEKGQTHNLAAGAGFESFQTDENNDIEAIRLRSGFLGNVLGFSAKLSITDTTTATAHVTSPTQRRPRMPHSTSRITTPPTRVAHATGATSFGSAKPAFLIATPPIPVITKARASFAT